MEESVFGKGLVICLVKFAEHKGRWFNDKHLYLQGIEVPDKWKDTELGKLVLELKSFGLVMGQGFTRDDWIENDVSKAYNMCQQIALLIDKEIGLEPDIGKW